MTQYAWVLEVRPGYEEEYVHRHPKRPLPGEPSPLGTSFPRERASHSNRRNASTPSSGGSLPSATARNTSYSCPRNPRARFHPLIHLILPTVWSEVSAFALW